MTSEKKRGRRKIPEAERLKLWVRAGGRCEICNRYLLEGQLAHRELTFGEAAHIIGQQATERSPRGFDDDLDSHARDNADNLMLVCDDEHDEIDKAGSADAFGIEFLRELKRRHEDRIFHQTSMAPHLRTCPVRMIAELRGRTVGLDRSEVAAAVMHGAGRFPEFEFSSRNTIEIDLRPPSTPHLPRDQARRRRRHRYLPAAPQHPGVEMARTRRHRRLLRQPSGRLRRRGRARDQRERHDP